MIVTVFKRLAGASVCAILLPWIPLSGAVAQEAGSRQLEEIVVTAQRRAESVQDVPISITAISGETIERSNVQTIEDYFAMTPNVGSLAGGSRDRKDLSIRGISNQLIPFQDVRPAAYAFYIDEFNVVAGTSNPQILDLERIEILRGPQGTYFGRNSVGGAINVVTRKPDDEFFSQVGLGYSSFDTRELEGILNIPVVEGKFALRAVGSLYQSDGHIRNIHPIGGGNDAEYWTGRISARFTPNDRFTWDLTYSRSDEELGMQDGVPTGEVTTTWRNVYYGGAFGADPDGVGFYPHNRDRVNFNRPQSVGTEFEYISSRMVHELDRVSITGVVGYLDAKQFNYGDVDGSSIDFFFEELDLVRDSVSGELRIQSTDAERFDWTVGIMLGYDTGTLNQYSRYGSENPFGMPEGMEVTAGETDSKNRYQAVFAQGTWHFNEQWSMTTGLRFTDETIDRHLVNRSNEILTNDVRRERSFTDVSPRLTLTYKPYDNLMTYGTISKGFKSGGVQTSEASLREGYEPEELWNYELGMKFDVLDRRLRFDGSIFYMDWENVQQAVRFQFIDPDTGLLRGVTGVDNAAAAHSYGVELSVDAIVTDRLSISGHAGFLEAKYDAYTDALIDGEVIDASGMRMIAAPRWTLGAHSEYGWPVFDDYSAFVRGEWNFRDSMYSSKFALRYERWPFISPSYNHFNLRMGLENERLGVVAYVENLFDENYYSNAYEKAFYSGEHVEPPSYRRVGVKLTWTF